MADMEIIGTIEQVTELVRRLKDEAGQLISSEKSDSGGRFRWRLRKCEFEKARPATCATCKWFVSEHHLADADFGPCHRNAPTVKGWPSVLSTMFCGQHEAIG